MLTLAASDTGEFFATLWHYVPIGAGLAAGCGVLVVLYWLAKKCVGVVDSRGKTP